MSCWLLVHSPLLGPGSWEQVAAALRSSGSDAVVPDLRPALAADAIAIEQGRLSALAVGSGPVLLAAHSGAGLLLPTVAAALAERGVEVAGSVFVDAGLPEPGRTRLDTIPEELREHLSALESGGVLPPWPTWFPPGVLEQLLPDPAARDALAADAPSLPWRLFTEPLPDTGVDVLGRCAYLRLSDVYDEPAREARDLGWSVVTRNSHHLAPLTDPGDIAAGLDVLSRGVVDTSG